MGIFSLSAYSRKDHSKIIAANWLLDAPTNKKVSLTLIICTFKKEEYVISNVNKLIDQNVLCEKIKFVIVDNSNKFVLSDKFENEKYITVLRQNNFGGAGGFSRGMLESAFLNENITDNDYLILMDDDIIFDPNIILKTKILLEINLFKYCIGGQMFDSHNPNVLEALGTYFSKEEPLKFSKNSRILI
ncbi:MAG: glycosyltransferase [Akkermansiaceae bacterium]|nr:glycosyltransferase [Akkermansiaceae bacterium]